MYCRNCGAKLEDGQKFCPQCGTPTGESKASEASEDSSKSSGQSGQQEQQYQYQQSYDQQAQQNQQQYQQQYQQPYAQDEPGRGDAIASMVLGIIAILCWFFGWSAIVSVILAVVGLVLATNAKKKGYTGGMQTAGFVLCIVSLFGAILIFIACMACAGVGLASLSLAN